MEYDIVAQSTTERLIEVVRGKCVEGWVPLGGIAVATSPGESYTSHRFLQAITRAGGGATSVPLTDLDRARDAIVEAGRGYTIRYSTWGSHLETNAGVVGHFNGAGVMVSPIECRMCSQMVTKI